ncbi:MAG: ABC transporter permease [Dehalococcoidia bacterium]|jgi:ABC-2 type transport system permease protein/oleandomycin transport system permease protein
MSASGRVVFRQPGGIQAIANALSDIEAVAGRNLITYFRVPQLLVFSSIQPVIFVLLFRYVFGGAVRVPTGNYVDFLMPGIFVQTTVFGAIGTAVGLATDLQSGLLERFRSLPMSRAAVLAGRTMAELGRNAVVLALMLIVGFAVGWRPHTDAQSFIVAMALVLLFGYVFSWIFAGVGLLTRDPESAQAASFPVLAILVFASSAFVPTSTMPGWLRVYADHQPVSVTISAVRTLLLGGSAWPDVLRTLAWMAGILAVFAPLSVWRYQRTT